MVQGEWDVERKDVLALVEEGEGGNPALAQKM